jgi:hypothetical protein
MATLPSLWLQRKVRQGLLDFAVSAALPISHRPRLAWKERVGGSAPRLGPTIRGRRKRTRHAFALCWRSEWMLGRIDR